MRAQGVFYERIVKACETNPAGDMPHVTQVDETLATLRAELRALEEQRQVAEVCACVCAGTVCVCLCVCVSVSVCLCACACA